MLPMLGFAATRSTVHHVSSTGADDGDGSISAPWRSLSFAGRQIRPGDTLFLARNCTWFDETLVIASAANVTIASYGPSSLPLPLLQMGRAATMETTCVHLSGATHTSVRELQLSGCSTGLAIASAPAAMNVLVEKMFFRDLRTPFAKYNPAKPDWATAIALSGAFSNLTVRNNLAARVDSFFRSGDTIEGLLLSANTVQQCSGNCYFLGTGSGIVMRDNVLLRDLSTRYFLYGTTDVYANSLLTAPGPCITPDGARCGERQDRGIAERRQPNGE